MILFSEKPDILVAFQTFQFPWLPPCSAAMTNGLISRIVERSEGLRQFCAERKAKQEEEQKNNCSEFERFVASSGKYIKEIHFLSGMSSMTSHLSLDLSW
ncbi:hypothetical protein CDAR_85831 [Caerostris darwini]|uniref:Uncharacterized protein n=2 Tax=Caerostris TaxID=172845 RepID=A0AAV4N0P4_9ARAC|nr:hypothetical protein CDAR_85831 [Caerostris darwini]GIY41326.1 hypothetical protein CEXT_684241 [Caerostris extrusa]